MRVFKTVPIGQDIGSGKKTVPKTREDGKGLKHTAKKEQTTVSKKSKEKWKGN